MKGAITRQARQLRPAAAVRCTQALLLYVRGPQLPREKNLNVLCHVQTGKKHRKR